MPNAVKLLTHTRAQQRVSLYKHRRSRSLFLPIPTIGFLEKTFCWLYQIWLMENIFVSFHLQVQVLPLGKLVHGALVPFSPLSTPYHTKTLQNIGLRTEAHLYKLSMQLDAFGQFKFPANMYVPELKTLNIEMICKFINNIDWIVSLIFWYKFEKIITSPINTKM